MQSRSVLGYALFLEIIELCWLCPVWRLALSMLRVSVRRLSCRTPEAVEFPQVQFSDKASIGLCAIPGVNIETSWVMSVWLLALSVLRVNVRGLSCRTPEARGDSTGAVLGRNPVLVCAILSKNSARSSTDLSENCTGVWRSECCESVFVGCRVDLLKPVEIPQVQFLDIYCGADRGRCHRS